MRLALALDARLGHSRPMGSSPSEGKQDDETEVDDGGHDEKR